MDTEGVTFPEAVERLAAMAGLAVPKMSAEAEAQEHRRRTLHDVMELAAKFFETTLASRAGAKARGYLADRSLDPATQLRFRIGYAPAERFALKEHLGSLGISFDDMVEAGLLVAADDIPVPYDRFRDRVMFPISDLAGRIVAFGGRALDKDAPAKYLNSPETPLFHKGGMLYNGASARQAAHQGAPVIVVEGYVDVIAMVTAGFRRDRRAARHRADRGPAHAAVEDGGRADPVLRRRQGRPARRLSGGRHRVAAAPARQEPVVREPARRPGPGRSGALGRQRRDRRRAGGRAATRRGAVDARDRDREFRHARAARRPRGAHQPGDGRDRPRGGAQILSPGPRGPAAQSVRPAGARRQARRGGPVPGPRPGRLPRQIPRPVPWPVPRQAARARRPLSVGRRADEPVAVEPAARRLVDRARVAFGAAGARGADPARR